MSLNYNADQVSELKSDISTIFSNTSDSYDQIVSLSSSISSDWSTEGSETFIEKFNTLTSTFDDYTTTLKNVIDYLTQTEEDYSDVQEKVEEIININ